MPWPMAFLLGVSAACRALICIVFAYAVFWLDRSGWWFALVPTLVWLVPNKFQYSREPKARSDG